MDKPTPAVTSVPQTHPPFRRAARWRNWTDESPYMVEVWRRDWTEAEVMDIRRINPANVAGLYWCPLSEPALEPEVVPLVESCDG